ncbi:MAG: hypothetical protein ILO36_09165 [Abditibacteriota bacterium]|nr:hypothetical protein [Abditibacteriota bacterium]
MNGDRKYRIIDGIKGESMLYSLEQLEHLKNNKMINADTIIKEEGEEHTFPAGALFDFDGSPGEGANDTDINMLGIVSLVLIFFFPLAGLITSIIGLNLANKRRQNRNLILTALIINAILVFLQIVFLGLFFGLANADFGFNLFKDLAPRAKWI